MPGWYWISVALGVVGLLAILTAGALSLAGMVGRDPDSALPPFVGHALAAMVVGCVALIVGLLVMVQGSM